MSVRDVLAHCHTCDKIWTTSNAQGVAAQHAKKYGHEVFVEVTLGYMERGGHKKR